MPLPAAAAAGMSPGLGAAISGGSNLIGSGLNALLQAQQNRKSRTFARGMYEMQRDDNIRFWRMQNAYNDPAMQMERLKNAGLNPALVYGQNASGASGAAGSINSPSAHRPDFKTPDLSGLTQAGASTINTLFDIRMKKQQESNLEKQNDLLVAQAQQASTQNLHELSKLGNTRLEYQFKQEMYNTQAEMMREQLRQQRIKSRFDAAEEIRSAERHPEDMAQRAINLAISNLEAELKGVNIAKVYKDMDYISKQMRLADFEIFLNDSGFTKNDSLVGRQIAQWADALKAAWKKFNSKYADIPLEQRKNRR